MRRFAACLSVLLLSACAQGVPPLNFSVPNITPSPEKVQAEVKSITVALARADEQETVFQPGQETLTPVWKTGLEEALDKAAVFRDDAPRKVSINVKILKTEVPSIGISFTVTAAALYTVTDRATGKPLFSERIETKGTTPADFAFLGLARAREAVNRAVQANIARFVERVPSIATTVNATATDRLMPMSENNRRPAILTVPSS